jgi:hypothetical protein
VCFHLSVAPALSQFSLFVFNIPRRLIDLVEEEGEMHSQITRSGAQAVAFGGNSYYPGEPHRIIRWPT